MTKAFDTVWIKGLLYKLIVLNFQPYAVNTVSLCLECQTFQTSFQSVTITRRVTWAAVTQSGLVSPVLFSLYVNDIHSQSRHVLLAQNADDMAAVATQRSPSLFVCYREAYLRRLAAVLEDRCQRLGDHRCSLLRPRGASKTQKSAVSRKANRVGGIGCLSWGDT
jgi:hypothetical protein